MAEGITIKPLAWEDYEARSVAGCYRVQRLDDKWVALLDGYYMMPKQAGISAAFDSVDEAKSYAQDDFETRIRAALVSAPAAKSIGWIKVPSEPTLEFLKSINFDNQVLGYENGRYYNAWFEFEPSEGGWFWTDEADSEPNPSYYRLLSEVAIATGDQP